MTLLITIAVAAGFLLVTQYGESVDEEPRIQYGAQSLQAYTSPVQNLEDEKGAFYSMLAYYGAQHLQYYIPGWKFIDGWHFMNFLAFVISIFFFYRLSRRLIHPVPALASTLLFATQPVIWGHAFINPKDIPFMAFFLGSVTLGLEMADHALRAIAAPSFAKTAGYRLRFAAQPLFWLAGLFLGFASAIRSLGIASGLLVLVYFLAKSGRKGIGRALPYLLVYGLVGILTTFLLWPYLWSNPVGNFAASLSKESDYPWIGDTLFGGVLFDNANIPISYIPTLLCLQFTEPALFLFAIGLGLAVVSVWKKADQRPDLLALGAWVVAPVAAAILLHSTIYNNFRQFLFIVPPLFVVVGLALQFISEKLKHRAILFIPLVVLALLPGVYWDIHLHPYQYIYYNSLTGGVSGAFNKYESDYWTTSNKEVIEYLNHIAPPNSTVYFWSNNSTAKQYARPDLKLVENKAKILSQNRPAGYIVLLGTRPSNQRLFPNSPTIHQISRDGNLLALIKAIKPGDLTGLQ